MAKRVQMSPEIEAQRVAKLAEDFPCYDGQWTVHETHEYELHVAGWLGGGIAMVRCPGKTEATRLGASAGGA